MSKAIGLRFVPYNEDEHLLNHFFGAPILPRGFAEQLDDSLLFLGQIHLPDIEELDSENRLPHFGNLYFFLDTSDGKRHLRPVIVHSEATPVELSDDFNEAFAEGNYPNTDIAWGIEFVEVDEDDEGCKLLGVPCDWNYENPPKTPLLLSISHFDEDLSFLEELDGYTYIFFGPKGHEFDGAYGFYEYS